MPSKPIPPRLAIFVCLLATSAAGAAELAPEISEADFLDEVPIVLSATRLAQPRAAAPVAMTVIDRDMIEASGAQEIYELLRLVPGFLAASFNGHNNLVTNYGLADQYARRIQVLIDGRSVYMPAFGGVPWADLPVALEDIERIEVVRGPNAASYGSNAFLGVINIITRSPAEEAGAMLKVVTGSSGSRRSVARYGGEIRNADYRFTLGYQEDPGFSGRHDDKRVDLATGHVDYRAGNGDLWELQAGINGGDRGEWGPGDFEDPYRSADVTSHFEMLLWRRSPAPDAERSVALSHTYYRIDDLFLTDPIIPVPPVQIPLERGYTAERYDLEYQQVLHPRPDLRAVWGLGARRDLVTAPVYLGRPDEVGENTYRLFGNLEWEPAPDWLVNLGGLVEETTLTGTDFAPRLALNWTALPHQTLRFAVSQATRAPSIIEAYADTAIEVNLPPIGTYHEQVWYTGTPIGSERITSTEIGWIGNFPRLGLSVDARLHRDAVSDLITPESGVPFPGDNADGVAQNLVNRHQVTIRGADLELRYQPNRKTRIVFGLATLDFDSDASSYGENYANSAPSHTLSLLASRELPYDVTASLAAFYVDEMHYLGEGDELGPISRVDLRLAKRFRLAGGRGEVALVVQDPRDNAYDFVNAPVGKANPMEQRAYLQVQLNF